MSFRAYLVTASFTSGSKIVTCPGAALTVNVYPGCSIKGADGKPYAIASIDSATQLTLENNYAGADAPSTANTEISRISSGLISTAQANVKYSQLLEALRRGFTMKSAQSLTIGSGTKVFPDVEEGLAILDGIRFEATSRANPANRMRGLCTYTGTTLTMTVPANGFSGSGTFADWNLNVIGADGATGASGLTAGTVLTYSSTTTDADPGSGVFRLNNATPASATAAYIDNLDAYGVSISGLLDTFDDSTNTVRGRLRLQKASDPSVWASFNVTGAVVDGTGYRKLTLSGGSGSGSFTNGDVFSLSFARAGDAGTGLNLPDTNASHSLAVALGSDLTANRTLTINTGDASRVIDLGPWTSYTPTVSALAGMFTSVSATGSYATIGRICFFSITVTITTNGTAAGGVSASLPFAAAANAMGVGRENAATGYVLQGQINAGSSTVTMFNYDNSYPGGSGRLCVINGFYQA